MLSKSKTPPARPHAQGLMTDPIPPATNVSPGTNGGVPMRPARAARVRPDPARGSAAFEREERQHQRAEVREENGPGHRAKTGERLHKAKVQPSRPARRTRPPLGKALPLGLIGIVVIGLIAGAFLGAASVPGWIIGLLVATLTVILSAGLQRFPRSRPASR